ncbi:hypothetical protein CLV24_12026 [Pontibacter ummariensis]|uniref:AAA domain-containing protein n=1 Tax=Pontibacter ummariensis TaxID=1610492 RepID=A0A239J2R2_9BACT|nr:hypothetical protein [Pontibacter ummariensis]PRY08862.1 hypothetical protein CLV24_12026 [Pontibacter ummariensis]SNT00336.1 hypothetical protein SAMN06296052_12025 [Pontibacter ummariensis]
MNKKLEFNRLFAYSEKLNKCFNAEFGKGVNIIHGRNTSGKSTLLLSLLYVFGINDVKLQLHEILQYGGLIFRLDCTLFGSQTVENLTIIREDESLIVKRANQPVLRFNGIGSDNSVEHIKLKHFFHELLGFSLYLESKNEYKEAPIETIFLPYYISQAVGWVYLRKSFSNLDYYRNFKDDYLDYYLGIDNFFDRLAKQQLEDRLKVLNKEKSFFTKFESNNIDIQVARINDEKFTKESLNYLETFRTKKKELANTEKDYTLKCNELSLFLQRKSVLSKVANHHKTQRPVDGSCPVCLQSLPLNLAATYKFHQESNDTELEINKYKDKIKKTQSEVNSLHSKISKLKKNIHKEYKILSTYFEEGITFEDWLRSKANIRLSENITMNLGEIVREEERIKKDLESFKTEEEVVIERNNRIKSFATLFKNYLNQLQVKALVEDRYTSVYKISAFPYQGVELHKTVMAYHFAFNRLIKQNNNIHRLPFILDAIFKEDIDQPNKDLIIKFISNNRPKDTQTFCSIAEINDSESEVKRFNKQYFGNEAHLICIGNGIDERAFLSEYDDNLSEYLLETLELINSL